MRRKAAAQVTDRAHELARVAAAIDRLVQAIIDGTPARAVKERLDALEGPAEDELEAKASEQASPLPALHPAMAEVYRQKVSDLAAALNAPETRGDAAEILRGLIDTIELRPSAEAYDIFLRGDLAGILTLAVGTAKSPPAGVTGFRKWRGIPEPRPARSCGHDT